jgi:hypothetical protein
MAENINALILPIGADASQFEKSIKEVKDALKSLQKEIAAKPFNLVTDQQIDQLRGLESTLERLQGTVKGTSNSFDQGEASTKKASRALNSLSLVAQDAPFGFIGIQNNLPGVITAFGQLDFKTNGLKGGLKELGASLVGPAGLFLAFSAVTAAVTFAIKEYGSLTNAVKVLFGANSVAIKSQNEFNKALADAAGNSGAQIAKINILVKTIQDENTSQQDRLAAYRELKKINPDVVAGIDEQNLSTSKSIKLIGENAKAQLEFIKLQTKSTAISKALDDLEQRRFEANGKFNASREAEKKLISDLQIAEEKRSRGERLTQLQTNNLARKNTLLDKAAIAVQKERDEISKITADTDKWYKSLEPVIGAISKISSNADDLTKKLEAQRKAEEEAANAAKKRKDITLSLDAQELDAAFNLDKIISSITKYGNALLDTNKSVEERKNALKELVAINPQVFSGLSLEKSATLSNKDAIESYLRSLEVLKKEKEFNARASQINADFLKAEQKSQEQATKAEEDRLENLIRLTYAQDEYGNSTDKIVKKNNNYLDQLYKFQQLNDAIIEDLTKGLKLDETYTKAIQSLLNFGEYTKKITQGIARDLRFLQEPFEGLFTTILEQGSANWKSFADEVIKQIKRIAASLLSKALINGISYLLTLATGGGAGLIKAGLKGISTEALGDFLENSSLNNVNFGGVNSGGLQMAGSVNLQLRGSDLVASINRTNSTINRIG